MYALLAGMGVCMVTGFILGAVGNFQTVQSMPYWAIYGTLTLAGAIGPFIAFRKQQQFYESIVLEMNEFLSAHPKLILEFEDNDDSFIENGHFIIRIRNQPGFQTAQDVRVVIQDLSPIRDADTESAAVCRSMRGQRLLSSHGSLGQAAYSVLEVLNIHAGDSATVSVTCQSTWENRIVIGNQNLGWKWRLPLSPYRMVLRAVARDCEPCELTLAIGVNSQGEVIVERDKSQHN
jgi:hypothetical protein